MQFVAYWEPGFCGCPDCHPLAGYGETETEAVADYWTQWEEKHAEALEKMREDHFDARSNTR